jgi:hypothetical protein
MFSLEESTGFVNTGKLGEHDMMIMHGVFGSYSLATLASTFRSRFRNQCRPIRSYFGMTRLHPLVAVFGASNDRGRTLDESWSSSMRSSSAFGERKTGNLSDRYCIGIFRNPWCNPRILFTMPVVKGNDWFH